MSDNSEFIREIEKYVRSRGIAETTFGRLIGSDGGFVRRLREGRSILVRTEDRVRNYMKQPFSKKGSRPEGEATR